MASIQCVGDQDDGGGVILSSLQSKVTIGGKLVAVNGSPVSNHGNHTNVVTANGHPSITIGGIPINITGDVDSCGHHRVGGQGLVTLG